MCSRKVERKDFENQLQQLDRHIIIMKIYKSLPGEVLKVINIQTMFSELFVF